MVIAKQNLLSCCNCPENFQVVEPFISNGNNANDSIKSISCTRRSCESILFIKCQAIVNRQITKYKQGIQIAEDSATFLLGLYHLFVHIQNHLTKGTFHQGYRNSIRKRIPRARILRRRKLDGKIPRSAFRAPHSRAVSIRRDYAEAAYYSLRSGSSIGKKIFLRTCRRRRCFLLNGEWLSHRAYDARMVKIDVAIALESVADGMFNKVAESGKPTMTFLKVGMGNACDESAIFVPCLSLENTVPGRQQSHRM